MYRTIITFYFFLGLLAPARSQNCLPSDLPPGPYICWPLVQQFSATTAGFNADVIPDGFCGSIENNSWFSFSPCGSTVSFSITSSNCANGLGIQAIIYNSDFEQVSNCLSNGFEGTGIVTANGLTPGEIYHFMIDGFAGDICDYTLTALQGIMPPSENLTIASIPGFVDGPEEICPGMTATYTLTNPYCAVSNVGGQNCPTPDLSAFFDTLYHWNFPAGAILNSNPNSGTVMVTWQNANPGTITVNVELKSIYPTCATAVCAPGMAVGECNLYVQPLTIRERPPEYTYLPLVQLCEGECFEAGGQFFCQNGNYQLDLLNSEGCDSVVVFTVKVFENKVEEITAEICFGECYEAGGEPFCNTGLYEVHTNTVDGCDSLIRLDLTVHEPKKSFLPTVTLCEGECYPFAERRYCLAGDYSVVLQSASGCDSTVYFSVEVHKNPVTYLPPLSLCEGECFEVDGMRFCESGRFEIRKTAANGCDSTVIVNISKLKKDRTQLPVITVCKGECVEMAGQQFCENGQYEMKFLNTAGCDSVVAFDLKIRELTLDIDPPGFLSPDQPVVLLNEKITGGDENLVYEWRGPSPVERGENSLQVSVPGTYRLTVRDTLFGCEATANAEVFQLKNGCKKDAPTPATSTCEDAPFLCGEWLDGFCSSTDASRFSPKGNLNTVVTAPLDNARWLKWSPCETTAIFHFATSRCLSSAGLELSALSTPDCETFAPLLDSRILKNKWVETIRLDNLTPGSDYLFLIDGIAGDLCDFQIEVVSGVSVEPLVWQPVSEGRIEGVANVCPGEVFTYRAILPDAQISGLDECAFAEWHPDFSTVKLQWHVPDGIRIVGDSTGNEIQLVVPEEFIFSESQPLLPTSRIELGQIWAEILTPFDLPKGIFCELKGAYGGIRPLKLAVNHELEILPAIDLCTGDVFDFCGEKLTDDNTRICRSSCKTTVQEVRFHEPPRIDYGRILLCPGECFTMPKSGRQLCETGIFSESFRAKCGGLETVTIEFDKSQLMHTGPVTEICNPLNTEYSVSFDIFEGTPPYRVNNHPLAGSRFTSDKIPSGTPYDFFVEDSNRCVVDKRVNGIYDCGPLCLSKAGSMKSDLLTVCENETAIGHYLFDGSLEADDAGEFVLHTNNGEALGNLLSRDPDGKFAFDRQKMELGKEYYISHVVGNLVNGEVDLSDPCLSVSKGQPVIFLQKPEVEVTGDLEINCDLPEVELWATTADPGVRFSWLRPDGVQTMGERFLVNDPGEYRFTAIAENGCGFSRIVTIYDRRELPKADAGADKELHCDGKPVLLDGKGSASGAYFEYRWLSPNGRILAGEQTPEPSVAAPGVYFLTVKNTLNRCASMDSVVVTQSVNVPRHALFDITLPTCFDEEDGKIDVSEVSGGVPPFRFSLDEMDFSPSGKFNFLRAGTYKIDIEDRHGCRLTREVTLPQPPALGVELGDDIFVKLGDEVTLIAAATIHPAKVRWHSSNGETTENMLEWVLRPKRSGLYSVHIEDANGCSAADEVRIYVEETSVYIPSAFSPNGDRNNDVFNVFAADNVLKVKYLRVYDRHGQLLFERSDFDPSDAEAGWDGSFKHRPMPSDVYAYVAEIEFINGEVKVVQGDVTLVR